MRKHIIIYALIYLLISSSLVARWIDTGFIKWEQPNGEEFVARHWGDEWISWMETEDGYRIIESPNGWFHYAKLDRRGEFTPSEARVRIDTPLPQSKGLKRTQERIREIETERRTFYLSLQQQSSLTELSGSFPRTLKLGVVLIDFTPSRITTIYEKSAFDNMIFSEGFWYSTKDRWGNISSPHPENEEVFGSLMDYYYDQTVEKIELIGKDNLPQIINPPDPNNSSLPDWLVLLNSMQYYEDNFGSIALFDHLYEQAELEYGEAEMASYEVVAFIYGGSVITSSGSNFSPKFRYNKYIMGEHEHGSFVHIGTHAHEFAHAAFNASDEYLEDINPDRWSLMAKGNYNGPLGHGSCPAPFGAPYRVKFEWVDPIILTPDIQDQTITYSNPSPNLYKVDIYNSNEYFILERRNGSGFDQFTPDQNGNNNTLGILIWQPAPSDYLDFIEIEYADNIPSIETYSGDRVPYPAGTIQNFNNETTPSSQQRDGNYTNVEINNIEFIGFSNGYGEIDVIDPPPLHLQTFMVQEVKDKIQPYTGIL